MHHGNKQAYDAAFERARHGKPARNLWETLLSPLEDTYTRDSRERGWRDGTAAREAQQTQATAEA
jgi:hypothetical protein